MIIRKKRISSKNILRYDIQDVTTFHKLHLLPGHLMIIHIQQLWKNFLLNPFQPSVAFLYEMQHWAEIG